MDYEKLHKDTITKLHQMVNSGKITVETACGICADFVPESEDDEKMIRNLQSELSNLAARKLIKESTCDKYYSWLESLKDRVQPQPKQGRR